MSTFSKVLLSVTYSLNDILMVLPEKLVAPLAGTSLVTEGGVTSFGPPTGADILAQLEARSVNVNNRKREFVRTDCLIWES